MPFVKPLKAPIPEAGKVWNALELDTNRSTILFLMWYYSRPFIVLWLLNTCHYNNSVGYILSSLRHSRRKTAPMDFADWIFVDLGQWRMHAILRLSSVDYSILWRRVWMWEIFNFFDSLFVNHFFLPFVLVVAGIRYYVLLSCACLWGRQCTVMNKRQRTTLAS